MLTIGSLFSGIGGLELGLEWAGLGPTLWQVECDEFCSRVLKRHWPASEVFSDVRGIRSGIVESVDLICGGFPCQDVSSAGKGVGLAGERSGLWREFDRVVSELCPEWVVVENVASGARKWVDHVVRDLGQLGYASLPLPVSAQDVGAPHRRARIFVVARRVRDAERERGKERDEPWRSSGAGRKDPRLFEVLGGKVADSLVERAVEQDAAFSTERSQLPKRSNTEWNCGAVADNNNKRLETIGCGKLPDQEPAFGYDAYGRSGKRPWPPAPGDEHGWQDWIAAGGPPPSIRRGADGLRAGLDKSEWEARLRALGNAVVPQCSEVIGYVIRELMER